LEIRKEDKEPSPWYIDILNYQSKGSIPPPPPPRIPWNELKEHFAT